MIAVIFCAAIVSRASWISSGVNCDVMSCFPLSHYHIRELFSAWHDGSVTYDLTPIRLKFNDLVTP